MRIKTLLVPLIAGTIFLSACSRTSVSLSYTNAKGEVPVLGNFIFRFNQSMVKDSLLNAWDSTEYVSFEPLIKGKFRWESPDQLVFSPSQPLECHSCIAIVFSKLCAAFIDVLKLVFLCINLLVLDGRNGS